MIAMMGNENETNTNIRILYIDDEPSLLDLGKAFLSDSGFEVTTTTSPEEALKIIFNKKCDVVISDYEMPIMNGIELLKRVRKRDSSIIFILFTGRGRENVVIEALNNGADYYLQKGSDIESMFFDLKQKIKQGFSSERRIFNYTAVADYLIYSATVEYVEIEKILKLARTLSMAEVSYVALIEGNELVIRHYLGIKTKKFKEMRVPRGFGMGWDVIIKNKGVIVNNYKHNNTISHESTVDEAVEAEGIHSAMAVPIFSQIGIIGVLYVFRRTPKEFTEEDLKFISSVGSYIGTEINKQNATKIQKKLLENVVETNKKLNFMGSFLRHDSNNNILAINGHVELIMEDIKSIDNEKGDAIRNHCEKILNILEKMKNNIKNSKMYQQIGIKNPIWQKAEDIEKDFQCPGIKIINNARDLEVFAEPLLGPAFNTFFDNTLRHGQKATQVTISYNILPDQRLVFVYEDDGVGIKQEDKDKIFDYGFGSNTGIGLFLVKEILSAANMQIKETGEPGKGARFEITILPEIYRIIKK